MIVNKVYLGDCLKVMKEIPGKSIDMILCDLPYGMTELKWDEIIPLEDLWKEYRRIIKDKGVIALTASQPFASRLIMSNLKWFRHEIIWEKPVGTNFMNAKKMPLKVHESIMIFGDGLGVYNPQFVQSKPYISRKSGPATDHYRGKLRVDTVSDGKRYPRSVLKFSQERGLHPTQKPVKLFEWLIKTYTNESMTVLDNCAGSGTTAIAAINCNRNYILIEKEQNYYDICSKRIEEHFNQLSIVS